MEDEDGILLHEKEMCEIILGELFSLKVEFGKIGPKGGTTCSLKRTKLVQT
jgi:hypothetical protein